MKNPNEPEVLYLYDWTCERADTIREMLLQLVYSLLTFVFGMLIWNISKGANAISFPIFFSFWNCLLILIKFYSFVFRPPFTMHDSTSFNENNLEHVVIRQDQTAL